MRTPRRLASGRYQVRFRNTSETFDTLAEARAFAADLEQHGIDEAVRRIERAASEWQWRACEACGSQIERRIFPSGKAEAPSMYAKRRYCSAKCFGATRKGLPPVQRRPDPERYCENCGQRMTRNRHASGLLETLAAFRKRHTCSSECRAELPKRTFDPAMVGRRTLLARSCTDCGTLKPASAYPRNAHGYLGGRCMACVSAKYRANMTDSQRERESARAREWQTARWMETINNARHWGDQWTGPELELVASRDDLSVTELALMLGRTYAAVVQVRHLVKIDPRKENLAGLGTA